MWRKRRSREVLVVGAGPIGQWTALLLAERGIDVGVVDQAADGERASEVILHPATLRMLDDEGLAEEVVAAGRRIESVELCDREGRRATLDLSILRGEYPFALTLDARALGQIIEGRLRRLGVSIDWDTRCAGLENREASVRTDLERFEEISTGYAVPHRESTLVASYSLDAGFVIGADGAHSLVRRRLRLPLQEMGTSRFAVFEGRGATQDPLRVVLHDDGRSVFWPLPGDRWRWVMELPAHDAARPMAHRDELVPALGGWAVGSLEPEALTLLLARRAPWLAQPADADVAFELWTERRLVERFGVDRIWLAGDAAHLGGPLAGDSLNLGFLEAKDLAWRISWILHGRGDLDLVRDFGAERAREWNQRLMLDRDPPLRATAPDWILQHSSRLASCLPLLGTDLGQLLTHVGTDLPGG